jgi:hypothetical protein
VTLPRLPSQPDDRAIPTVIEPRREVVEITDAADRVVYVTEPVAINTDVEVVMPTWWHGDGPPGVVVGAAPGDFYVDDLTGNYYRLI